jgi:uncharacterized protein YbcI
MSWTKFLSRGQMEAAISETITRFEKEYMGRGPLETRTYIIENLVITRLKGILTQAEMKLVRSDKNPKARELIKQVRIELIESGREILETLIRNVTHRRVKSLHTDISTMYGEKIIIFTLDKPPEIES